MLRRIVFAEKALRPNAGIAVVEFDRRILNTIIMTKLKLVLLAVVVAILIAGTANMLMLNRDPVYTPPSNPNPDAILQAAQADSSAGRYREALAKHIWFRDNALKYEPAESGVRDSFALSYWAALAEKYPPAMKKLKAIREQAIKQLQEPNAGRQAVGGFIIALSINNGLNEKGKSIDLFKWLDSHNPTAAKGVYLLVENDDLITAKEYAVCGRYMDADRSYAQILSLYNLNKGSPTPELVDFAVKSFSNQTARLVAVLAINNKNDDALRISNECAKELTTPEFAALLASARNGTVPAQWP
jgi:hypothetical protein